MPLVNGWYTNLTGQLFKVRLIRFDGSEFTHTTIEYINGRIQIIAKEDWDKLKLKRHGNGKIHS